MKNIKQKIRPALTGRYFYLALFWFVLFFAFTIWVNELYIVGSLLFHMPITIQIPFIFFLFANSMLIALSLNLAIIRIKTLQRASAAGSVGVSFIGTFIGILGGACPGCIAGLFPVLMAMLGVNFALIQLPLFGLEFQIAGFALLIVGIHLLTKPIVCKI